MTVQRIAKNTAPARLRLHRKKPAEIADILLLEWPTLVYWNGAFHEWHNGYYQVVSPDHLYARVYQKLKAAEDAQKQGEPFPVDEQICKKVQACLQGERTLVQPTEPFWIDNSGPTPRIGDLAVFPDKILNVVTGEQMASTPRLFSHYCMRRPHRPDAPPPTRFLQFLDEIYMAAEMPEDAAQQIGLLQRWLGYIQILENERHQFFLQIVGDPGSGKTLLGHIMDAMLAEGTVVWPEIGELPSRFGLWPLDGRQLAIHDDVELPRVEPKLRSRMKNISSGSPVVVDRKGAEPRQGPLPCKMVVISNPPGPAWDDLNGSLSARILQLDTRIAVRNTEAEDKGLKEALLAEMDGIVLWALEGARLLQLEGRFPTTDATAAQREDQTNRDMLKIWLHEACDIDDYKSLATERWVRKDHLYERYVEYMQVRKIAFDLFPVFCGKVVAATGQTAWSQRPKKGDTTPRFRGIHLRKHPLSGTPD